MSNKWNRKRKNTRPRANDGKDNDRILMMDVIARKEREKIQNSISNKKIPEKSLFQRIRDDGRTPFFIVVLSFMIIVICISAIIQVPFEKTPITLKLKIVNNYSNYVEDECRNIYTPVYPQLSTSITSDQKEKDKSAPSIILNETDTYDAYIISSYLTKHATGYNQITGFKLVDPSKYIKNC